MKSADLEGPIHKSILHYLRLQYPGAVVHHSPNENSMKGPEVARLINRNKSLGMCVGFPDLIMLYRGCFYAFEVKAGRNKETPGQKAVGASIEANGGVYAVVRSIEDVKAVLQRGLHPVAMLEIRGSVT